jgi:hypothetical protein
MLEFFHAKKVLVLEEIRTLNLTKFDESQNRWKAGPSFQDTTTVSGLDLPSSADDLCGQADDNSTN